MKKQIIANKRQIIQTPLPLDYGLWRSSIKMNESLRRWLREGLVTRTAFAELKKAALDSGLEHNQTDYTCTMSRTFANLKCQLSISTFLAATKLEQDPSITDRHSVWIMLVPVRMPSHC